MFAIIKPYYDLCNPYSGEIMECLCTCKPWKMYCLLKGTKTRTFRSPISLNHSMLSVVAIRKRGIDSYETASLAFSSSFSDAIARRYAAGAGAFSAGERRRRANWPGEAINEARLKRKTDRNCSSSSTRRRRRMKKTTTATTTTSTTTTTKTTVTTARKEQKWTFSRCPGRLFMNIHSEM